MRFRGDLGFVCRGIADRGAGICRQGALELLLLSALFFREGYPDDSLHGAGKEDGVCGGSDLGSK